MDTRSGLNSRISNLTTRSGESTLSPTSSEVSLRRPSSFHKLWWSLRDKKRVEQILHDFTDLNGRIHESIKLWCLGTSIGVNMQHLNRLQDDANSRTLGFDVDAGLQIAVSQSQAPPHSLEIDDPELHGLISMTEPIRDGSFSILPHRKPAILIERRSYAPQSSIPVEMDNRTNDLVDQLARLLHQRKGAVFRTPPCQGWIKSTHENPVAFVFSVPESLEPSPTSMLDILRSSDLAPPSLGSRFWLALKLAKFVSQLQLVKWVRPCQSVQLTDPDDIKKHLVKHAEKRLGNKMGERYKNVVLTCLNDNFNIEVDTKEDLKLQQAFRSQVVEILQRAAETL